MLMESNLKFTVKIYGNGYITRYIKGVRKKRETITVLAYTQIHFFFLEG